MLTVNEVAEQLGVSRGTIINLIKKGQIKAIRVGTQYKIPQENLDMYISTNRV